LSRPLKVLLWWILAGTKGGKVRAKILLILKERPMNASQLATQMQLDYKTIRHHLRVLTDNKLLESGGGNYGSMYFLSPQLESNFQIVEEILEKIGKEKDAKVN